MLKNIIYTTVVTVSLFAITLFVACKKNMNTTNTTYGVDVKTNPSLVNKSLRLNGQLKEGKIPSSSGTGGGALLIVQHPEAVEVAAGVDVYIPFKTIMDSNMARLYVQVEGADSYWELDPRPQGITSGPLYMKVFIPNFVHNGEFNLSFSVQNFQGKVSSIVKTQILITGNLSCNTSAQGSIGITVKAIDLGNRYGLIRLNYNTYTVPDRIDIKHNNIWKASTGDTAMMGGTYFPSCDNYNSGNGEGFIGDEGMLIFERKPGEDKNVYIYITGCESSTLWDISLECPEENWYENLPPCPCTYDEAKNSGTTSAPQPAGKWKDYGHRSDPLNTLDKYHYGASYEVRWEPDEAYGAGQQCTYDANKKLIIKGIAAGSPDKISPKGGWNYSSHESADIIPWENIPYNEYLSGWPANNQKGCTGNSNVSPIEQMQQMLVGLSCKKVSEILKQADIDLSDSILKNYIKGVTIVPPSDLKSRLQAWRTNYTFILHPTICKALDEAIDNL